MFGCILADFSLVVSTAYPYSIQFYTNMNIRLWRALLFPRVDIRTCLCLSAHQYIFFHAACCRCGAATTNATIAGTYGRGGVLGPRATEFNCKPFFLMPLTFLTYLSMAGNFLFKV